MRPFFGSFLHFSTSVVEAQQTMVATYQIVIGYISLATRGTPIYKRGRFGLKEYHELIPGIRFEPIADRLDNDEIVR